MKRLGAVALLAAALLAPGSARAWPRPHDAPAVDAARPVPEVTPEYASVEEAGIRLVYHPQARDRAHTLLVRALALRTELTQVLGRDVLPAVEIRVAAAPAQLSGLSPAEITGSAAAFRHHHLVVMSLEAALGGEPPNLEERLRHELAHLGLDEAVGGHDLPRWFHEGFAADFSGEDGAARAEALTVAALQERLLGLREVDARFPEGAPGPSLALAQAADFVRFLRTRPDHARFTLLIEHLRAGVPLDRALPSSLGADLDTIELSWRKDLARRYSFVPVFAGATLLWVVVAAGISLRRRRQAAAERESPLEAAERLSLHDLPGPLLPEDPTDLAQAMPPDPEVPKVEHGGRWYTLH